MSAAGGPFDDVRDLGALRRAYAARIVRDGLAATGDTAGLREAFLRRASELGMSVRDDVPPARDDGPRRERLRRRFHGVPERTLELALGGDASLPPGVEAERLEQVARDMVDAAQDKRARRFVEVWWQRQEGVPYVLDAKLAAAGRAVRSRFAQLVRLDPGWVSAIAPAAWDRAAERRAKVVRLLWILFAIELFVAVVALLTRPT